MTTRRHKILIVEDEAIIAMDASERVRAIGMDVVAAVGSGPEALAMCRQYPVDAALMDVRLSGPMDGIQTAHALRDRHGVPVVFLTAHSDEDTLRRIANLEPYGYLLKPLDDSALLVTLKTALRRSELERAREEVELERRRIDCRYREILDHSHDGIVSVDEDQRIVVFNRGAEAIFGWTAKEALGQPLDSLLPTDAGARHRMLVGSVMAGSVVSRPMTLREVQGRRRSGETFPVEVSISRLDIEGQRIATAIIRDLTERRRLEARFQHGQKLETIGRVVSSVAHDFNNQLVPIAGYADLLLRALPEDHACHQDAVEIRNATTRATRLTRQLLLFGRREVQQVRRIAPDAMLKDLFGMLQRVVGDNVTLHLALQADGALISIDPSGLEQLVMNLVVNARDAMPDGGEVRVSTELVDLSRVPSPSDGARGQTFVAVRVADTGMGIDEATQAQIFEPFFTTKPSGLGTGLGLATVCSIAQRAGGVIDLDSQLGGGSVFSAFFPLAGIGPQDQATQHPPAPAPAESPRGARVMVVDDDDDVRRFVTRVLQEAGYCVTQARLPSQALRNCPPDLELLITDLVMPEMSGAELAVQITQRKGVKVLFMTGHCDQELAQRGLDNAGAELLRKPFGADALEQAVLALLQARRTSSTG